MPPAPETRVGLDVGGTRIRAARVAPDGALTAHVIEPVVPDRDGFVEQVTRLIDQTRDATTSGVGIGIPGRVTQDRIISVGYLDIAALPLARMVTERTGLPCHLRNDASMALIAEGRGTDGLIAMVTVGTGVGGALLRDGRPWDGGGFAGQFGHIVVSPDGPPCNCGRRGCIETLSAGPALGILLEDAGLAATTTAAQVLDAAEAGDGIAKSIVTAWAAPMVRALQSLVAVVDPAQVIVGGGLGTDMVRALKGLPARNTWFGRPVTAARLGDTAGVVGAGLAGFMEGEAR